MSAVDRRDCPGCMGNPQRLIAEALDPSTRPDRRAELIEVIGRCPECFRRYEVENATRLLMQRSCREAHAPEGLKQRIISSLSITVRYQR